MQPTARTIVKTRAKAPAAIRIVAVPPSLETLAVLSTFVRNDLVTHIGEVTAGCWSVAEKQCSR
jgi:hypothetical protein